MKNRKLQIVELTLKLIQTKGYVAISYDDLAKPLGVTKASIHYHFEKKEDLGLAVADQLMLALDDFVLRYASLPAKERLEKFLENRVGRHLDDEICPVSSLQSDYESLPEAMQKRVTEISEKELDILQKILTAMQQEGVLDPSQDPASLAFTILSSAKGTRLYNRVFGKNGYEQLMAQVSRLFV